MRASSLNRLSAFLGISAAFFVTAASAQTESILYNFSSAVNATGRFLQLKSGGMLGTTYSGGTDADGNVYQLKESSGVWKYKQVYSFDWSAGANPADGVTLDGTNVYFGTTQSGGSDGYGTIYRLASSAHGWVQSVIHNFGGGDGEYPETVLIADTSTNTLYGTTNSSSGGSGCGTAFSIKTNGTFSLLYAFEGGSDGCHPQTGMTFGTNAGTMFGTTTSGGAYGEGTVFELKESDGIWSEHVIHSFKGGSNGGQPTDFRVDANGNLFGVATGGLYGQGIVFELTKSAGSWKEKTIYSFRGGSDGASPVGLHIDLTTNAIYGATEYGGTYGAGTAFQLTRSGAGWYDTILHSFGASGDGAYPVSRPVQDKVTGNLYGTTLNGGQYGTGVVYTITLPLHFEAKKRSN